MLVFLIPLQSKRASKDWTRVSALVRRTLRSVLAQTHPAFRVYLICTDLPELCPSHPAMTIVPRDFPEPELGSRMLDKWTKVRIGLASIRSLAPCHVMVTDADDCVSNRLAAHVSSNPHSFGWCFDEGWLHDERSRLIYRRRHGFDDICGTSSIVRMDESDLPGSESDEKSDNIILRSGHTTIRRNMVERGTPLEILPFAGAVYNLATGENWSPFSLRRWKSKKVLVEKLIGYRLLTPRIRSEFGLVDLEKE